MKNTFSHMSCPLARAMDVIGEWWTVLILRDFFLADGRRRFEELRDSLGISRNILTERLNTLVEHDVLAKTPVTPGARRQEYQLTEKGRDLMTAMLALTQWASRWLPEGETPPVVFLERGTGQPLPRIVVRDHAGETLDAPGIAAVINPQATDAVVAEYQRVFGLPLGQAS